MDGSRQPLAEVFGHLPSDNGRKAKRSRNSRLCPFNNKVPNCTKDKADDPLGVCSVLHAGRPVITCPIRFRESWLIAEDAAGFFFSEGAKWTSLTEVRLHDLAGKTAGNIDVVLVQYDSKGTVTDFGALEVQAVYISGNVRRPFEYFMEDPAARGGMDWGDQQNYPRPDYLSSSRKRLAPQLLFKGGILNSWHKKLAVAMNRSFFDTLPPIARVPAAEADIAWLLYELVLPPDKTGYELCRVETAYTRFAPALETITRPEPGNVEDFLGLLQRKLDEQLESPPNTRTIGEVPSDG